MSDTAPGFASPAPAIFRPLGPVRSSFARDRRFWPDASPEPPPCPEPLAEAEEPAADPLAVAHAEGYRAGRDDTLAEAAALVAAERAALEGLASMFTRLDQNTEGILARRLAETVEALCDALIADVAVDGPALLRRAGAAARLLARADDERTFRLNPEDLAAVGDRLPPEWKTVPDPALERGSIRIETPAGGVEDGPGAWRRAIAEAIAGC